MSKHPRTYVGLDGEPYTVDMHDGFPDAADPGTDPITEPEPEDDPSVGHEAPEED